MLFTVSVEEMVYLGEDMAAGWPKRILNGEDMHQFVRAAFREIQQAMLHTRFG